MSAHHQSSLVGAIYERYGEIGGDACSNNSCSINCSEFSGSSSSSSCSPIASPIVGEQLSYENSHQMNGSTQQQQQQHQLSPNATNVNNNNNNFAADISFFIPPVCSPRKTRKW